MKIHITPSSGDSQDKRVQDGTSSQEQKTDSIFRKKPESSSESGPSSRGGFLKRSWNLLTGGDKSSKVFSEAVSDSDTDELTEGAPPASEVAKAYQAGSKELSSVGKRIQAYGVIAKNQEAPLEDRVESAFAIRELKHSIETEGDKEKYLSIKKKLEKEGFGAKVLNALKDDPGANGARLYRILSEKVVAFRHLYTRSSNLDQIGENAFKVTQERAQDKTIAKFQDKKASKVKRLEDLKQKRISNGNALNFAEQQLAKALEGGSVEKQERFLRDIHELEQKIVEIDKKIPDEEKGLQWTNDKLKEYEQKHERKWQELSRGVYLELQKLDRTDTNLFINYIKRQGRAEGREEKVLLQFLDWNKGREGSQPAPPKSAEFAITSSRLFHGFLEEKVSRSLASPLRHS